MNPPDQLTQPTEAHRKLWTALYNLAHREIFEDYAAASEGAATQLIADFEARAVAQLRSELNYAKASETLYHDEGTAAIAALAAARSERDLAITRVASILWSGAIDKHTCGDVQKWTEDYTAELTRLRAEVERLKEQLRIESAASAHALHWAEKAEAELHALRLVCGTSDADKFTTWLNVAIARAEKAEAELITEQTRLDYLALQMGTPRVADALDLDYSLCFPIRDAIDLAMKNESNTP